MPAPDPETPPRRIDAVALQAQRRRLALQAQAPWLHGEVARRMAERLPLIRLRPGRIVDWGSFLGAGAKLLRELYPQAELIAVDPEPALAQRSRQALRQPWWSPARWRGAGVQVMSDAPHGATQDGGRAEPRGAQLVWSNMGLHAEADPPSLLQRWHDALAPEGFVMLSCFGPDTGRELRALYRALQWPAPGIDFVDMHDIGDMLVRAGFADPVMDQETIRLQWDSPEALLNELRLLGGNVSPDRAPGLRTPRWRQRLLAALEGLRAPAAAGGRIGLGFEIAYGHAFKAVPRQPRPADTTVSLDAMRAMVRRSRRPG